MTSKRFVVLAGLLAGALILPGVPPQPKFIGMKDPITGAMAIIKNRTKINATGIISGVTLIMAAIVTIIKQKSQGVLLRSAAQEKRSSKTARNCARIIKT